MSVRQANDIIEDHSQVEIGYGTVFVGVYDGHGGPQAFRYISDYLFAHLMRMELLWKLIYREFYLVVYKDTHLGGEDFDHRMMDYFIKLIKKKHQKDVSKDKKALGKLRRECERTKRAQV